MDNTLQHHGIKGQKWGVRNGPPYPLDSSNYTTSKKKKTKGTLDKSVSDAYTKSSSEKTIRGIDPEFLQLALSIVPMATIVAGKSFTNKYKRTKEKRYSKNVNSKSDLPTKKECSKDADMAATNPKYKQSVFQNNGYINNCMYCTAVYDLRRRGYNVTANSRSKGGNAKEITEWYKDAELKKFNTAKNAEIYLKAQPEGSRGNVCAYGAYGGHSVAYEIDRGKVKIRDCQVNKSMSLDEFTKNFNKNFSIVRTDNCEPNWKQIGEVIDPESLRRKDV